MFFFYASRTLKLSFEAGGNIASKVSVGFLTHYTLTVWKDAISMKEYVAHPIHIKAMKWSRKRTKGRVYHYESDLIPNLNEAKKMVAELGRDTH